MYRIYSLYIIINFVKDEITAVQIIESSVSRNMELFPSFSVQGVNRFLFISFVESMLTSRW